MLPDPADCAGIVATVNVKDTRYKTCRSLT
jgi:hypothetical protein